MSDVITLANEIVKEKERIRQAIEYRGVTIPASTPFSDYHNKILSIDTQVEPNDLYYKDEDFDESLTSFTVPANYESLMENSLSNYTNLQILNLNYVKYIFDNTCAGDTSLTSVSGNYLKYIGCGAFIKTALTSFSNDSVEYIGDNAFRETSITSLTLDKCKIIGNNAFYNCDDLVSIDLGDTEIIKNNAFNSCKLLKTIIADNVKYIGDHAFSTMDSEDYAYDQRKFTLSFPKVEKIGPYAFNYIQGLTGIDLPNCKIIGFGAFNSCPNLISVNAPKTETINESAFDGNNSISTLYIPNCTYIGNNNFYNNTHKLTEITVADGCVIGNNCFAQGVERINGKIGKIGSNVMYSPASVNVNMDFSEVTSIGSGFLWSGTVNITSRIIDLKNCTSINCSTGCFDCSTSYYARKIWLNKNLTFLNGNSCFGMYNRNTCHVYTDATEKPSNWGTILNNAIWHFGATHEEFEEA